MTLPSDSTPGPAPTGQARAPQTQPFDAEAFQPVDGTVLRWLGMAGFLINSRGTTVLIDPPLGGFDMPILRILDRNPRRHDLGAG